MNPLPPLNAVRVFEAAARYLNFTRAAAELGMTQAAVSYQIRQLEDRVGTPLFVRGPRQVTLTEAGERLAPQVAEALEMLRAAFTRTARTVDSILSITALPAFAGAWLVPRLGAFHLAHPGIAVQLETSQGVADLGRDGFDVGLRYGNGDWPGLVAHRLVPSRLTAVCSPAFRREAGLAHPSDLLRAPLLGPNDPWWQLWFAATGVGPVDLSDRVDHSLGSQQFESMAAATGQGVALINPLLFAAELASGRLVQIFDQVIEEPGRAYWITCVKERRRVPKIRAFWDWAVAEAERV
ncbi:MAG TPA: LysR substrate-binding domain-containing protein [Beijerinckiaceae bacterium]|jgi:LysR family glycine cleavage system transcriptional activator